MKRLTAAAAGWLLVVAVSHAGSLTHAQAPAPAIRIPPATPGETAWARSRQSTQYPNLPLTLSGPSPQRATATVGAFEKGFLILTFGWRATEDGAPADPMLKGILRDLVTRQIVSEATGYSAHLARTPKLTLKTAAQSQQRFVLTIENVSQAAITQLTATMELNTSVR